MADTAAEVLTRMGIGDEYPDELRAQSARLAHVAHPKFRTDLWVRCFDGMYRFWLTPDQIERLEAEFAYTDQDSMRRSNGILRVFGAIAKGRYELEGRSVGFAAEGEASLREIRRIIVEALVGGRAALIDGEIVGTDRGRAVRVVAAHLDGAPVEDSWSLAFAILHTIIHGRPYTEAEDGKPSTMPIIPNPDDVAELGASAPGSADVTDMP